MNAATSTGMVAHGASNYNLNYYGVTADTPQNYGSMYYMDFGSAEEVSVDTAAMGAEVGGGGGANINVIPKTGGNTRARAAPSGASPARATGTGFTGSNITDELRAQGITDPTLRNLNDFNANAGGPFLKDRLWWFGSFRNYSTVEATPYYTVVNADGSLTNPFDSNLRNYTASGKYQVNKNNTLSAFWTYNRKFQPNRGAGTAQPKPINTLHQESPKNLINGNWTSVMGQNTFLEVSSTYFHMHWPSTWADEFNALPADQQRPSTFNVTSRHLHRRPGADRPAFPRRLPAPDQHRRDTLHRRLPRRQPSAEDRLRELVDADRHRRLRDLRRHAPPLQRPGRPRATRPCGPAASRTKVFLYNTPLTQETKMRNFAGFVQDRASYQRFTLNLGLRWSYFDGKIPEQSNGGGRWFPVTTYPEIDPGYSVEHVRAAHRHRLQADRGRQERRQGELQPLLRVDVHRRVQQHQPELDPDRRRPDLVVPRRPERQRPGGAQRARRAARASSCRGRTPSTRT